jgi:SNF2 family DNA or RNA helicase
MNTKGATNMEELRARLQGFMLRREKAEVAPELPPRIISRPVLDLTPAELSPVLLLEEEMGDREAYLSPVMEDFSQLGDMARLSRAIGLAKVKRVAALVEDLIDSQDPDNTKIVIFARHRDVIKGLCEELKNKGRNPVSYVGGMNDRQKGETVKTFVDDGKCQVFIGQIQAAGTGINGLQKVCRDVVFAELSWVPGEMAQAIDRCHRIGQTRDAVNVYLPHVPGTLESAMLEVQKGKEAVIGALVGGASPSSPNVKDPLEGLI